MPTELSGTLEVISTGVGSSDAFGVRWVRPEEREPERWKRVIVIFRGNLCVGHAYWREDQENGPMKWSINGDKKEFDPTWRPEFWLDGLSISKLTPNTVERTGLLPCPFCGTYAEVVHESHIRCGNIYNCDCHTRLGAQAWNRRHNAKLNGAPETKEKKHEHE